MLYGLDCRRREWRGYHSTEARIHLRQQYAKPLPRSDVRPPDRESCLQYYAPSPPPKFLFKTSIHHFVTEQPPVYYWLLSDLRSCGRGSHAISLSHSESSTQSMNSSRGSWVVSST